MTHDVCTLSCAISHVTKALKIEKLQSIDNQPSHLWKEQKAIRKLRELGKEKPKVIKQLLARQAFWQVHSPEDTLPEDRLYCDLLQPEEEHDDQCKRATNRIWSKKTYRLSKVVYSPGNWVMYHLKDGLERVFIKEELMLIPEDTSCDRTMSKDSDASKSELPNTRTHRAEQGLVWINPKVARSAN